MHQVRYLTEIKTIQFISNEMVCNDSYAGYHLENTYVFLARKAT
jgi:hypothetical protein